MPFFLWRAKQSHEVNSGKARLPGGTLLSSWISLFGPCLVVEVPKLDRSWFRLQVRKGVKPGYFPKSIQWVVSSCDTYQRTYAHAKRSIVLQVSLYLPRIEFLREVRFHFPLIFPDKNTKNQRNDLFVKRNGGGTNDNFRPSKQLVTDLHFPPTFMLRSIWSGALNARQISLS